jgi:hypothetical protein
MSSNHNTASRRAAQRSASSLTSALALGLLGGCAQGPSEAEFVQACLSSSSPQMGVTQAICQCGAREARSKLPADHYRAMVLTMQGKKQEAESLLGDMSFEKRAEFAMEQFQVLGQCLEGK